MSKSSVPGLLKGRVLHLDWATYSWPANNSNAPLYVHHMQASESDGYQDMPFFKPVEARNPAN